MKIALQTIGSDRWIAGVHYISNLVKAIQYLPTEDRPEVILVMRMDSDRAHYADLDGLIEYYPGEGSAVGASVRSLKRKIAHCVLKSKHLLFVFGRLINRYTMRRRYEGLVKPLKMRGVDLIFPCQAMVGKDYQLPWIPWVWDLQHKYYPELFPRGECKRRDKYFQSYGRDAKVIITSSESNKCDYAKYYPGYEHKVRVLRFRTIPSDSWYKQDARAVATRHGLPEKYLVISNQYFAHKNHIAAAKALKILNDRGIRVAVASTGNTKDWRGQKHVDGLNDYIRSNGLESQFLHLGLLPRQDQIQILRCSTAVLQPSLFEGWSTVVEDARALGKRIFLSNIPVHREQNPPGAVYFDPHKPADLAAAIEREWHNFDSGPCEDEERAAAERQRELIAVYARDFMDIAHEVVTN